MNKVLSNYFIGGHVWNLVYEEKREWVMWCFCCLCCSLLLLFLKWCGVSGFGWQCGNNSYLPFARLCTFYVWTSSLILGNSFKYEFGNTVFCAGSRALIFLFGLFLVSVENSLLSHRTGSLCLNKTVTKRFINSTGNLFLIWSFQIISRCVCFFLSLSLSHPSLVLSSILVTVYSFLSFVFYGEYNAEIHGNKKSHHLVALN